jgi:hypothetical protein
MKCSNVLACAIAFAAAATACGRQTLDEAPAVDDGAPAVAPAVDGGAPPVASPRVTTVVSAARAPAGSLGRDCLDSSDCSWWQDPDPAMVCCAGTCMNTRGDAFNCGGCGLACAPGEICVGSTCQAPAVPALGAAMPGNTWGSSCADTVCAAGEICCGGTCVRPDRDATNCGACGVACRATGVGCYSGVCCPAAMPVPACHPSMCPEDRVSCDGDCKELGFDAANCGACGAVCPPSAPTCVSGLCVGLSR